MIRNEHFAASFDAGTGTLELRRGNGAAFLSGAAACANTHRGKRSTASPGVEPSIDASAFRDRLGAGRRLDVFCRDPNRELDLRVEVRLYDGRPTATVELHCTNVSPRDIAVASLEPVRAAAGEGGVLRMPGVEACLTNGQMYWDAGTVHAFGAEPRASSRPPVKGVRLANHSVAPAPTLASWWNVALFGGYHREGVVLGYLENTEALGVVLVARAADGEIAFLAESVYAPPVTLPPGRTLRSNRFMLHTAPNPYAALEEYADAVGAAQNARTRSIVNGWCSWFYTLGEVTEDEVLRNTELAARHLRPFGLAHIQIDEGYQRAHGDWEGNERFPHGMRWLAGRIAQHGFVPGLWVSPYVISEAAEVFQRHPDWMVHRRDGSLQRIGNWPSESSPEALAETAKRYCLDVTHPDAARWLHDLFRTIAHGWGYRMIKIDFMTWSILAAERYRDPTVSSAAAYRRGLEVMRTGVGADCHILECGPGNATVGLIDSMRIEADVYYGFADVAWRQYFQGSACSLAAAAKRYYFHRRTWINDADHVCIDALAIPQAQAAATAIALSGGNTFSGDRLVDLGATKLEIVKKILPSSGEAAVPVDLFDADVPTTFVLPIERPFAVWWVVAFFNPELDGAAVERRFDLRRLGLDPDETYLAFDFWNERFVGEVTREIAVGVAPGSVTLLSLHVASGEPQVLSTNRHVAQGAIELEHVRWNALERTLEGVSVGPAHSSHDVFVHVPGERPWTWGGVTLFHDYPGYDLRLVESNIVRVHLRFGNDGRVPWRIRPEELFA